MASITERNGRFLVRVRRTGFPTATKSFTLKRDAAAWIRRVETDMEAGRWGAIEPHVPTFKQVVQEYRVTVGAKMKGAATYKYRFDEFERLPFADRPVDKVTTSDLSRWRDDLAPSLKPATVIRKLAMLSGIFRWAMLDRAWISVNPVTAVRRPLSFDSRSRTLSDAEASLLLEAASTSKAVWLEAALTVLMHSAMRRSELFGLCRADVDYTLCIARLGDTKNGSPRDVPLCPASLRALRKLDLDAQEHSRAALMPLRAVGSLSTRFAATVRRARALYEARCATTGTAPVGDFLIDLRLHDLRHHAVTMWAETGSLSLIELMGISGHKTTRMLARYTHLQPSKLATKLAGIAGRATRPS
jgi:integrase